MQAQKLIDISQVNFKDIQDIIGSGALIIAFANRYGILSGTAPRQSRDVIHVTETAKRWVGAVKSGLSNLMIADALPLVDMFDLIHRIGFSKPADSCFIETLILDAFDARIHGDKSIDEYNLHYAIEGQLRKRNHKFLDKPLQWNCLNISRWHKNFKDGSWLELSDYDILRQLFVLISANLFAYEFKEDCFKRNLVETNRHYLDETEGKTILELETLLRFLSCSRRYIPDEDYWAHNKAIVSALIVHPNTNPYYRQSFEMNLAGMSRWAN